MTPLRRSLWSAAAAAFLAGVAIGLAIPVVVSATSDRELTPDEKYVERFTERYDLDASQRRQLHCVLRHRQNERFRVVQERSANLPSELENELRRVMDTADHLISTLLTDSQRERYLKDQGVAGTRRDANTERNK